MEREIARIIARTMVEHMGLADWPDGEREELAERLSQSLADKPGESLAISVMTPKTAALAFDRVYRIPVSNDPVPEGIGFYCATPPEIGLWAAGLARFAAKEVGIELGGEDDLDRGRAEEEAKNLRSLCSQFSNDLGIVPTLFYHAPGSCQREFPAGSRQVLAAAISQIAMVDEKQLTWGQVTEFRRDVEVRNKYRRLVRWVDDQLRSKSAEEVQDLIALRLDDYEWALRKHGIKAALGALSCLLDPKFLGTASATVAATGLVGGSVWAALAGTSVVVGRALLSFGTAYIDGLDERRGDNYEVAYVHDVRKQFG